jgi:hypothetical protein
MLRVRIPIRSIVFLGLLVAGNLSSFAQLPKGNPKNLGVDSIKTTERQIYGFALGRRPDGSLDCAVDRAWLLATYPELESELDEKEQKNLHGLKEHRIARLKNWIQERDKKEHIRLRLFLESELERLQAFEPEVDKSEFVLLSIESNKIVRMIQAKPEQRQIAAVAYKHHLKDVTTTSAAVLERKLKEIGVDPKKETFDLSTKLPKLIRESDKQWAIRQALVEYDVLESVELQGKGNLLMGAKDRPDPFALFKELQSTQGLELFRDLSKELRLNLGSQLEQTEQDQWRQSAIEKAEKKDARGALVLRLQQNLYSGTVKVTAIFLVKGTDGAWFDVYHGQHENDGSQASQQELDRLRQDPTIQKILPMIEAIGGADQIERALRQGAATNLALSEARSKFNEYKSPYSRNILSPPPPEPTENK